jgi:hypothetical protein
MGFQDVAKNRHKKTIEILKKFMRACDSHGIRKKKQFIS